jgi:hypothetical protein
VLLGNASLRGDFGGEASPVTFVVDRGGKVIEMAEGPRGRAFFEERVRSLLADAPGGGAR